jgi:hypothetical protein
MSEQKNRLTVERDAAGNAVVWERRAGELYLVLTVRADEAAALIYALSALPGCEASAPAVVWDAATLVKAAYAEGFGDAREQSLMISTDSYDVEPFWRDSLARKTLSGFASAPSAPTPAKDK